MHLKVTIAESNEVAALTTKMAEGSHGQPVLVVNGNAYGLGDLLKIGQPATVCQAGGLVLRPASNAPADDIEAARRAGWNVR